MSRFFINSDYLNQRFKLMVVTKICSLLLLIFTCDLYAQIPTITNSTPQNGATGYLGTTSVVITGTNFNSVISNNLVRFGGAIATITQASSTQLTVTAPWGSTWNPLTVTNLANGLTAFYYFKDPFTPTFQGEPITSASFPVSVSPISFSKATNVTLGDLDGDGKPDLVASNLYSASPAITVARNTSTLGTISFAARQDIATTAYFPCQQISDIDGDGKADIIAYLSSGISVFRNTSTSGAISFASKLDFSGSANPYFQFKVGDIDGDGKPDCIVSDGSKITIFKNTSSPGNISFSTNDFIYVCTYLQIADVNGDGKPDIIYDDAMGGTAPVHINILTNSSTPGTVSFTNSNLNITLNLIGYLEIVAADFDSDGKIDFATASTPYTIKSGDLLLDNSMNVYRNTTTGGNVSFSLVSSITINGLPGRPVINDINGDGKPDILCGYVDNGDNDAASSYNDNTGHISILINTSIVGTISFNQKVDISTGYVGTSRAIDAADLDGDGQPDIAIPNRRSDEISFKKNAVLPITNTSRPLIYTIP